MLVVVAKMVILTYMGAPKFPYDREPGIIMDKGMAQYKLFSQPRELGFKRENRLTNQLCS